MRVRIGILDPGPYVDLGPRSALGLSPGGLFIALPALLWAVTAVFKLHRPAIALPAVLTPFMVGRDLAVNSFADPAVPALLRPSEMLFVAVGILLILVMLVALWFSFAAGRQQLAAARAKRRARREAEEDRKRIIREEEENRARVEADKLAERQLRKERVESAVASVARKIVAQGANAEFSRDELTLLALVQDSERETALLNEAAAVRRADEVEAELEESREAIGKLKQQLIRQGVANFAGGMLTAGLASVQTASAVGGAYAARSVGRAGRT